MQNSPCTGWGLGLSSVVTSKRSQSLTCDRLEPRCLFAVENIGDLHSSCVCLFLLQYRLGESSSVTLVGKCDYTPSWQCPRSACTIQSQIWSDEIPGNQIQIHLPQSLNPKPQTILAGGPSNLLDPHSPWCLLSDQLVAVLSQEELLRQIRQDSSERGLGKFRA